MAKGYIAGIGTGGGDSGGTPTPPEGTLNPNEMVKRDPVEDKMVGTGDTNTDTTVDFGSKDVVTTGTMTAGTGTFNLGAAHGISSAGENVTTTNLVSGLHYNPVWIEQNENIPIARLTVGAEQALTQEASKADILVNPSWQSDPVVDWRVVNMTFEVDTTITNVVLNITKSGSNFYSARLGTLTANVEKTIDLSTTENNVPAEAFTGDAYILTLSSVDGDVRAKGSTANALPFFKIGYFEMVKEVVTVASDLAPEMAASNVTRLDGLPTQASGTTVNVPAGQWRHVTFDAQGVKTENLIDWVEQLGVVAPVGSGTAHKLVIDVNGDAIFIDEVTTDATNRDYANLAIVSHPAGVITSVIANVYKGQEVYSQLLDNLDVQGVTRKSGLAVNLNADLTFDRTAGILQGAGAGVADGQRGQNLAPFTAAAPATFDRILGITNSVESSGVTLIDPGFWDNGTGSKVAIGLPTQQATIVHIYQAIAGATGVGVLYGQTLYPTLDSAILNAPTDIPDLPEVLQGNANLIDRIAIRSDATNLLDPLQAQALGGVKFGTGLGGSGFGNVSGGGDMFGAASSTTDEAVTFADNGGHTAKQGSNVSIVGGTAKRILSNADLTLEPNGTGAIVAGNSSFKAGDDFEYPTQDETVGDQLVTDGNGALTLQPDNFQIAASSATLGYDNKRIYIDSAAGDMTLTLADNPRVGERKLLWMGGNANVVTLVSANPSYPINPSTPPAESNIEGMWTLTSDFLDRFSTGNDLANSGTGGVFVPITVNGEIVNGFNFQGTAWLEGTPSGYEGIIGSSSRSAACWYQATAGEPTTDQTVLSFGEDIPDGGGSYWEIEFRSTQGYFWVNNRNAWRSYPYATLNTVNLFDGNAHHIAVTQSNASMSTVSLYIDGVFVSHSAQDTQPNCNTKTGSFFKIGAGYGGNQLMDGILYDVRLFNRGLTAQEVVEVRDENIVGGVNLSALNNGMVIDVTFNGSQWVLGTGTEKLASDLDGRVTALEDSVLHGAGQSTANHLVTFADDTGQATSNTSGISALAGVIESAVAGQNLQLSTVGNVESITLNPTTGNIDIADGADGNANFFFGRAKLSNPVDEPGYLLYDSLGNALGGISWEPETIPYLSLFTGNIISKGGEIRIFEDGTVETTTTTASFVPPLVTSAQRNTIDPVGIVSDTDLGILFHGNGTDWDPLSINVSVIGRVIVQSDIPLAGVFQPITTGTFAFFEIKGETATPDFVNGIWTVPLDGTYQFNVSGWPFTGAGVETQCRFYTEVNGLDYTDILWPGVDNITLNGGGLTVNGIVKLNAGDEVQIAYSVLSGTGWELDNFRWDIARVGA